jgi:ribonuclease HI
MSKKKFFKYLNELEKAFKAHGLDAREELEALSFLIEQLPEEVSLEKAPLSFPAGIKGYALYSDGACRGNPGPGAWASLGMSEDHQIIFKEAAYEPITTNNRMELLGAINALKLLMNFKSSVLNEEVHLYSDSKYVTEGITAWVPMWKSRGWKKADNKAPENIDLWMELTELAERYKKLRFHWVKGHSGHAHNDQVDLMCNEVLDQFTRT